MTALRPEREGGADQDSQEPAPYAYDTYDTYAYETHDAYGERAALAAAVDRLDDPLNDPLPPPVPGAVPGAGEPPGAALGATLGAAPGVEEPPNSAAYGRVPLPPERSVRYETPVGYEQSVRDDETMGLRTARPRSRPPSWAYTQAPSWAQPLPQQQPPQQQPQPGPGSEPQPGSEAEPPSRPEPGAGPGSGSGPEPGAREPHEPRPRTAPGTVPPPRDDETVALRKVPHGAGEVPREVPPPRTPESPQPPESPEPERTASEEAPAPGGRAARRKAAQEAARRGGRRGRRSSATAAAANTATAAHTATATGPAAPGSAASGPKAAGTGSTARTAPRTRLEARRAARARKDGPGVVVSRLAGELFITLGVLMLLFVTYQLWWTNIRAHQIANRETDKLHKQWAEHGDERAPGAFAPGKGFAIMYIPKLDVKVPVAEGISKNKVLDRGMVGHYAKGALKSAMPWDKKGNFAVAGHRNTHGEPFRYINRLKPGDEIVVETQNTFFTYEMTSIMPQTPPSNVSVIKPVPTGSGFTAPGRYITLTTCTPEFTSTYRMIVWGKMVDERPRSEGKPDALVG
ncbi:class E sortase [Streptomyces sp. P1-3]|uniref:class E sortase n=1 Tax=Streptomyces sp. P1-3 TaxID=3421658 RepID=UPI003D3672AD